MQFVSFAIFAILLAIVYIFTGINVPAIALGTLIDCAKSEANPEITLYT